MTNHVGLYFCTCVNVFSLLSIFGHLQASVSMPCCTAFALMPVSRRSNEGYICRFTALAAVLCRHEMAVSGGASPWSGRAADSNRCRSAAGARQCVGTRPRTSRLIDDSWWHQLHRPEHSSLTPRQ